MSVEALLEDLGARGIVLRAIPGGAIHCSPKGELTSKDIESIREHKQELLKLAKKFPNKENIIRPYKPCKPYTTEGIADTYGDYVVYGPMYGPNTTVQDTVHSAESFEAKRLGEASELGLVARFSPEFGWISVHNPLDGEWHDIPFRSAEGWMKREAFKRKDLHKSGRGDAYTLTQSQMEEIWAEEQAPMWDEPYKPDNAKDGLIYDVEEEEEE